MSVKPKAPKRIWIRQLKDDKMSVAEYVNNRRRNIVDPFKPDDTDTIEKLKAMLKAFALKEYRSCIAVADTPASRDLAHQLNLPCE